MYVCMYVCIIYVYACVCITLQKLGSSKFTNMLSNSKCLNCDISVLSNTVDSNHLHAFYTSRQHYQISMKILLTRVGEDNLI